MIVKLGGANNGVYHSSSHPPQCAAAKAAGLAVDHYWFNGRMGSVASQIATIIDAGIEPGESLWWDVEAEGSMARWTPGEVVLYANALAAAGIPIERQGVYLSSSVTRAADWSGVAGIGLRLWVADYGRNDGTPNSTPLVAYWRDVELWQYTSVGRFDGYDGNLDVNIDGADVWTVYDLQTVLGVDRTGVYDRVTTEAVRDYQAAHGLFVDGDAGTITLGTMTKPPKG